MMNLKMRRSGQTGRKGFNLIEAAIVLGIVGLVVGGIWVSAASVYQNMKVKRSVEQVLEIAQKVRTMHATSPTITATQADLITAGVFPTDMRDVGAATLHHPWGIANTVLSAATAAGGTTFDIIYNGLSSGSCSDLATRVAAGTQDRANQVGLVGAVTAPAAQAIGVVIGAIPAAGYTVASFTANCTNAGTTNSVAFRFRIAG